MRVKSFAAAMILIGFAASAAAQTGQKQGPLEARPTVTVSATASVSADPDLAVVRLGAVAVASHAAMAQNHINAVMQKVLAAVTALGVPDKAIRTESLSLSPIYDRTRPRDDEASPQTPRITAYRAENVVGIELHDLTKIGAVVDAGINAGANQLQGISFQLKNSGTARAGALAKAVQDAHAQAASIADALAMRLAGVSMVVTGNYSVRPPMPYANVKFAAARATPVQPGQIDVSASVTVTYYIQAR